MKQQLSGLLGQVVPLMEDGRRLAGVMVAGHQVSSSGPGTVDLLLPTRVGEPEKRVRVTVDMVELAPERLARATRTPTV
jgi:hypothetical protein